MNLYTNNPPKGGFFVSEGIRLQFKRLSTNFAQETRSLTEVLTDKGRGYCVAEIEYKGLFFAVPLRTNLPNIRNGKAKKIGGAPTSFVTDRVDDPVRGECYRGLDYEKALLLRDRNTDLDSNYPLPDNNQKTILNDNEFKIKKEFMRYVESYVRAHKRDLPFKGSFFRSTLCNYHAELDI
ncbi:hypothetical protein [Vibrio cholerae]|uniref:hypothetical protein n=1 Tax=Vibrio cholerae TaxID=666 RepID=UPI0016761877|nr:hypothetical protein [Vibrio cholerae]EJL6553681.1 hypothetical protein [Vibrio cholerae]MBD1192467.1 hypothetical protein [Vibrio cholerae]MBP0925500.1 hypothetical protein [Vibrio cholerae]